MSIRKLIIILIILMATAPLGIFIYTANNQWNQNVKQALTLSSTVANKVLTEQSILTSVAEQLAITLSHVPAIRNRDSEAANQLLEEILASSPQYATIFMLDAKGVCWAAALPRQISLSYAERRYFRNAVATGRFSSGEFNVGKVLRAPVFSFAYPFKDTSGSINGVAVIVINLDRYRQLYEQKAFSLGASSMMLVDHKGTILFSSLNPQLVGTQDKLFQYMVSGTDGGTFEAKGNNNILRLFSFRKIFLKDESTPYMYVRIGVSKQDVLATVYRELLTNVGILSLVLLLTLGLAILLTKRGIHDKIITLRNATHAIANGDLTIRVADRVSGGELGELGCAFDEMALKLAASIHERQQAERHLMKSEEEFRLIFEEASDAIFWADATTGILLNCNKAAEEMMEAPREELIGKHQTYLHPPEMEEEHRDIFTRCAGGLESSNSLEALVLSRSGKKTPVQIKHSVTVIGDRKIIQGIFRDISERRQAEEELRHSQKLLSSIVENAPYAIFVKNVADNFRVILWNHAAEQIFGIPATDMVGKNAHDLWPRDQADAFLAEDYKTITQRAMMDIPEEVSYHPQKGSIYIHTRKIPLFNQNGEVSHIVVISDDITERRTVQAEFVKHQKLESLGVLAGGIAHDFNNILTGILGNISFARMFLEPSHKAATILVEAEKASQRASDLAYQLLTFAKGGQPIKKVVEVQHIIEASLSLVLRGSKVKSILEIPDSLHAIEADEGQMHQVFNNIIINALQSMPDGGILTISADLIHIVDSTPAGLASGPYVKIFFADTGCGIREEDQKRIFDPYFTTKNGGTGLGLASAYAIIGKHGGQISVRSVPGTGTTFEVLLPASQMEATAQKTDSTMATPVLHGKHPMLIMDDDPIIRNLAESVLEELGYSVKTCTSGEEAIEMYRLAQQNGQPFAAVIMDLTIPGGMGGKEAAAQILKQYPGARLVVSSGYSNDPVMADYLQYGFSAAMLKPYNVATLASLLGKLLSESQTEI